MADEAKDKTSNDPRPYVVWEVAADGSWKLLGTRVAKSNADARKTAASEGEADGEPRSGQFYAAALSSVQGEEFVKELKPNVDRKPLSLVPEPQEVPEEAPAKTNGRSRRRPAAPTPEPEGATA